MPHVFHSQKLLLCMVVTSWCCRVSGTLPGRHLSEWALRNTEEIIKVKEIRPKCLACSFCRIYQGLPAQVSLAS